MSNAIVGHERRDALISAAFEAIEDRVSYPLISNASFSFDRDQEPDSCSTALVSIGEGEPGEDDTEHAPSSRIPSKRLKAGRKCETSEVLRLASLRKQYRQRVKVDAIQDEHRPWKVKALTALSHLTSLEQQCFESERRVCDLQSKYDALVLEKNDMEVECERYRAAWGHAVGRVEALELERRVLQGRVAMYETRMTQQEEEHQHTGDGLEEVDDVVKSILKRGQENKTKHIESKLREDIQKEHEEEAKKAILRVEEEYRQTLSQLEDEMAEMEIALAAHCQEKKSLQDTIRGLEEHLIHAQSRVVQLQEENEYYACFMDSQTKSQEDEDDVFKDAVWELKQEIGEREEELSAMQECLNEEKARSSGLHEQVLRQVMEIEDLRNDARRTRELEEELKALKSVHAETLQDVAELKLVQARKDAERRTQEDSSQASPLEVTQGGNPFVEDESWLM